MPHDIRRRPAEKKLDKLTQDGTNYYNLFTDILEEYPTWRGDNNSTVHATVMSAGGNYMFTKMYDHKAYRELSIEDLRELGNRQTKEDL